MACSVCNTNIINDLKKLKSKGITRKDVYDKLNSMMGGLTYVAAENIIPEEVDKVGFYGKTYKVLHLTHRICSNGQMTRHTEWKGVEPGTYLDSKSLCLVTYIGEEPISDYEAKAPVSRILHKHWGSKGKVEPLIEFKPIANWNAEFVWNAGLNAIEIVDDKPDIAYFDIDGNVKRIYDWMEEDSDTDEEQYENLLDKQAEIQEESELTEAKEIFSNVFESLGKTPEQIERYSKFVDEVLKKIKENKE